MKYLPLIMISFLMPFQTNGESDTLQNMANVDSTKYNFIVLDARYQNQFAFWGRDFNQNLPFLSNTLMYYSHTGFWASASHFTFLNGDIPQQVGLTLGYYKEVSPKIDWHSSYTLFHVPDNSIPETSKTQQYVQSTLGFDWGILFSSIQIHALINNQTDVFFSMYHSRYFEFNKLLWKRVKVSFEPKFSFTFGTHHFEYVEGLVIAPGGGGIPSQSTANHDAGDEFQALNWDFGLPLKLAIGNFSIEPSWRYTVPLNANPDYAAKGGIHQFALGASYSIPIKTRE